MEISQSESTDKINTGECKQTHIEDIEICQKNSSESAK